MIYTYSSDNPSKLYMHALRNLVNHGETINPRGKIVKELRPVVFEFTNPLNRVTFLKGRVINPFFQLAEALWIITGKSDVESICKYNQSISQFSDDGKYFNAPYGERLRFWNKNDITDFIYNPLDQLADVYVKLKTDKYTRQAVAVIYNPLFDNATIETLDRPCNIALLFKIRDDSLDMTVFNRSNDLHWGLFGANIVQFSTIQELMASWLGIEIGTYCHMTDSLHIYLTDYGHKETDNITRAYKSLVMDPVETDIYYTFDSEPRFSSGYEEFHNYTNWYQDSFYDFMLSKEITTPYILEGILHGVSDCQDDYLRLTLFSMVAYRLYKEGEYKECIRTLGLIPDCSWKVSCLRFLSKGMRNTPHYDWYYELFGHLPEDMISYIERGDIIAQG